MNPIPLCRYRNDSGLPRFKRLFVALVTALSASLASHIEASPVTAVLPEFSGLGTNIVGSFSYTIPVFYQPSSASLKVDPIVKTESCRV